jgi:hypothetical protein
MPSGSDDASARPAPAHSNRCLLAARKRTFVGGQGTAAPDADRTFRRAPATAGTGHFLGGAERVNGPLAFSAATLPLAAKATTGLRQPETTFSGLPAIKASILAMVVSMIRRTASLVLYAL